MGTVTVLGSINIDLVTSVPRLPRRGETVSGHDPRRLPGGKGANQAVACARAGATVRMAGACGGDDAGALLLDALRREGVDARLVRRLADVPTGTATILVEASGENVIALTAGANAHLDDTDVDAACRGLAAGDVLLMQLEIPPAVVRRAASLAADRGATVVLNAAPTTGDVDDLLRDVHVLIVNEHEARELAQAYGLATAEVSVTDCARRLADAHTCLVVATLGPAGALVTRGDEPQLVSAPRVQALDTVGAGDTFTGYVAAALSRGADVAAAIDEAVRAASIAVTRAGAQNSIPLLAELDRPSLTEGA